MGKITQNHHNHSHFHFSENHVTAEFELVSPEKCIKNFVVDKNAKTYDDFMKIAFDLEKELRYNEAIVALNRAIEIETTFEAVRHRAGKYLATLQISKALEDFALCEKMKGEIDDDLCYRMALCHYYNKNYDDAIILFDKCFSITNDELGVACIFWAILSSYRAKINHDDIIEKYNKFYRNDMQIGHHDAQDFVVKVALNQVSLEDATKKLEKDCEDLEFSILSYGIASILQAYDYHEKASEIFKKTLERNSFWISFTFLAAWCDKYKTNDKTR